MMPSQACSGFWEEWGVGIETEFERRDGQVGVWERQIE